MGELSSPAIERDPRASVIGRYARLLLIGAGLVLYSCIFTEIFIRVFRPQAILPRYVTNTPWGVRGNVPGARYWHRTPEVEVEYRINSQGMRADHDYSFTKPAGTCRVALFGDSFFVGYELDLADTIAVGLEKELNRDGIRAQVLNFAVSGFGTAEMIRTYTGFGRRFDPDLVIFEWHDTDPDDNVRSGLYRIEKGSLKPAAKSYLPGVAIQDALMRWSVYRLVADNSHTYTFLRERFARMVKSALLNLREFRRSTAAGSGANVTGPSNALAKMAASARYESVLSGLLLKYAHDTVTSEGREFMVVEIPKRTSRTTFASSLGLIPADVRRGLKILTPIGALRARADPSTKLYFEQGHGHLTPAGVQAVLHAAVAPIEESPVLDHCRSHPSGRG